MDFSSVRDRLDRECQFPIDHDDIVERFGDVELDAPVGDPETVGTVLERCGETSYESAAAVHATLVGGVHAGYVGRRNYDDRAGVRSTPDERRPVSV